MSRTAIGSMRPTSGVRWRASRRGPGSRRIEGAGSVVAGPARRGGKDAPLLPAFSVRGHCAASLCVVCAAHLLPLCRAKRKTCFTTCLVWDLESAPLFCHSAGQHRDMVADTEATMGTQTFGGRKRLVADTEATAGTKKTFGGRKRLAGAFAYQVFPSTLSRALPFLTFVRTLVDFLPPDHPPRGHLGRCRSGGCGRGRAARKDVHRSQGCPRILREQVGTERRERRATRVK